MTVGAAACPDAPAFDFRTEEIDVETDGTEQRLPLEGKLAQRQLRLMRSKLQIIAISWYKIATFDLIRSGLGRTTFPSRERLFVTPVRRIEFQRAGHAAAPTFITDPFLKNPF